MPAATARPLASRPSHLSVSGPAALGALTDHTFTITDDDTVTATVVASDGAASEEALVCWQELAGRCDNERGSVEIDLPLTQSELGTWCGASREMVNKVLGAYRDQGLICVERRRIRVLNVEALRRRSALSRRRTQTD